MYFVFWLVYSAFCVKCIHYVNVGQEVSVFQVYNLVFHGVSLLVLFYFHIFIRGDSVVKWVNISHIRGQQFKPQTLKSPSVMEIKCYKSPH